MSLGARGGAKGGAKGGSGKDKHGDKKDKPQPKEKVKPQATTEQIRMANMIDRKTTDDGADVRKMVQDLMEMTCRTEEEVCSALHDADNDMVGACNILLESLKQGEWQTSEKKKKKPPQPVNNGEAPPRERERGPGAQSRPRRGEGQGGRGSTRGGRGGRGFGRGGARGARAPPRPRADPQLWQPNQYNDANQMGDAFPAPEDWDNEEWSGSLSDTKVFTPSAAPAPEPEGILPPNPTEEWEGGTDPHAIPSYTYHNAQQHHVNMEQLNSGSRASPSTPDLPTDHYLQQLASQIHAPQVPVQPMGMSGSLSAAQTQYLSQLTQQTQRHDPSVYSSNYGVYGAADITSQRKPQQRARVPPPSKIPMSAVEMPGGMGEGGMFLDVQFGALEPDEPPPAPLPQAPLEHKHTQQTPPHVVNHVAPEPAPEPASTLPYQHTAPTHPPHQPHQPHQTLQLNESLTSVESTPTSSQPSAPVSEPPQTTNVTTSLDAALSGAMKQLAVSAAESAPLAHQPYVSQHRPKPASVTGAAQNVYAHHPVPHHPPPVYGANVYAPQVNSSNASLSAAAAAAAAGMSSGYPSSVALTQYQPILNSYQTSSSPAAYSSAALYTAAAAPYSYQPAPQPHHNNKHKETTHQYEPSSVSVSNSLSSTSTTQSSTAKVVTTTATHTAASGTNSANAGAAASAAGGAYAGGALYGSQGYAYDEQIMRSTMPHHMGGYYEVGYGVSGAREGAFGLGGAGERFGRTDAASPQQVPAAALPPGYAYFYQPPPTTYQYGVYPTYGGGSSVGGVSGGGKVGNYAQQQPQYEQQDTYKPGGGYGGSAAKAGGAANADLNSAMYAKTHVALNKVNSYEKAGFHSGTPPPFGAASHLYIPAPPHHHHHHQMDVRMNSHRRESGTTGGRASTNKAAHSKPSYSHSYWPPN